MRRLTLLLTLTLLLLLLTPPSHCGRGGARRPGDDNYFNGRPHPRSRPNLKPRPPLPTVPTCEYAYRSSASPPTYEVTLWLPGWAREACSARLMTHLAAACRTAGMRVANPGTMPMVRQPEEGEMLCEQFVAVTRLGGGHEGVMGPMRLSGEAERELKCVLDGLRCHHPEGALPIACVGFARVGMGLMLTVE